jgi:ABC-type transport system substrate-binding protein
MFLMRGKRGVGFGRRDGGAGLLRIAAGIACMVLATACPAAADPNKVLRIAFPTAETGFDPVKSADLYSATVMEAIFDRLLSYDYLARPAKLIPMAAESMPEVADDGRTYTFHLKKGVYFAPDPAFKGVKRELVAQDFIYTFIRSTRSCSRARSRAWTRWPPPRRRAGNSTTTPSCRT